MLNNELKIILSVQDKATAMMKTVVTKMQTNLQKFATNFKANWLAITASVAAAMMTIRKAWDLAQLGAKAKQIEESFGRMADSVGLNALHMKAAIMEAAGETVNFSNVAASASALMAQGLSLDLIADLMKQARAEARLFGQTTEDAFAVMTSAITGGLVTTLRRSYGLQLSLKSAVEDYAKANKLSTKEVQSNYMAQALATHILAKSKSHLDAVNLSLKTEYEFIQEVKSRWLGFQEDVGKGMWKMLGGMQIALDTLRSGFASVLGFLTKGIEGFIAVVLMSLRAVEKVPLIGEKFKGMADNVEEAYDRMKAYREGFEQQGNDYADRANQKWRDFIGMIEKTSPEAAEILKGALGDVETAADTTLETIEEKMKGLAEAQLQSLNTMRMQWAMYQDEELGNILAMTQRETEFYQVAIEARKKGEASFWTLAGQLKDNFSDGMTKMSMSIVNGTFKQREAFQAFGKVMLETLIKFLIQSQVNAAFSKLMSGTQIAQAAVTGSAVAAAWAPAAAMVSLATLGGNSAPASAALSSVTGLAQVLSVPQLAEGGVVDRPTLALIGESGPEAVVPLSKGGGGQYINIEINNPVVRSDEDIDALAEEVSTILAREAERL